MSLDSWMTAKRGAFESAEVFSRPPLRSRQFLACTFLVLAAIALGILVVVRFFGRLDWAATLWVVLALVTVLGNWLRALIVHARMHDLYVSYRSEIESPESPTDIAMRAVSSMSYWGSLAPAAAVIAALAALIKVLSH